MLWTTDSWLYPQKCCLAEGGCLPRLALRLVLWWGPSCCHDKYLPRVLKLKKKKRLFKIPAQVPCLGKWDQEHDVPLGIGALVSGRPGSSLPTPEFQENLFSPVLSRLKNLPYVSSCFPACPRCLCLLFQSEKLSEWSGAPHMLPDPCESSVWNYPLP